MLLGINIIRYRFLCICLVVLPGLGNAQDLSTIAKEKPFVLHGNIGTAGNFYSSNEAVPSQPPFSWNLNGNLMPTIYGIPLPVDFVITQYAKSNTNPFTQFGLSPLYKSVQLDLGYRSISFSPITFDGQSFLGGGIELSPKKFRFAAFYGSLGKKVNEDTAINSIVAPVYLRTAYGFKIGLAKDANHIELIYFHAKDDSSSVKVFNKNLYMPQENSVLGLSFNVGLSKVVTWSADFSVSGATGDLASNKLVYDSSKTIIDKVMGNFISRNQSTLSDYALQTSITTKIKSYTTTVSYKRVQPNFKSFGTPYMLNDVELVNWANDLLLLKGRLTVDVYINNQHNDLNKNLASEMNTFNSGLSFTAQVNNHLSLNASYGGSFLHQLDGTTALTDSIRVNQQTNQANISSSYSIATTSLVHVISTNFTYMNLSDKNPVSSPSANNNTIAATLNYTLNLVKKLLSFTFSGIFNKYNQSLSSYNSIGTNLSVAKQLLKERNLSIQGTIGYLINNSSLGVTGNNLTTSFNIGYQLKKHSFSLFSNYVYTPGKINTIISSKIPGVVTSRNLSGGISYNYSF